MTIFDKLPIIKNFTTVQKKSASTYHNLGDVNSGTFAEFLVGQQTHISAQQAMKWYAQASAVTIPVDKIAQDVELIRPVLRDEKGQFIEDHPVLDLINNPNGFETRDEFIGQVCRNWLLTHDSIIYAEGAINRPPSSLWAVKPQTVTITQHGIDGYPQSYNLTTGMGRGNYIRRFNPEGWIFTDSDLRQVYQIRGFSSKSENTYSDSPLSAIALEIRQQINGRYHNLRLLENGGRLSLIAIFKDELDEDGMEQRRQALNEHLAGPRNAGKIAVVNSEDMELKEAGTNNKDMDYKNLDAVAMETIARRYNIPLPMIKNDASTFNNLEQSVFHYYDGAVLPAFLKCYSGLSDMLLPRYGLDPSKNTITYNPDDIDALRMRRIEELSKLKQDAVITINEYRDNISLESVEGGDDILVPAALIPVARDMFTLTDIDDPEEAVKK